jgi:hypothetical protein
VPGQGCGSLERAAGDLYADDDAAQVGSPDPGIAGRAGAMSLRALVVAALVLAAARRPPSSTGPRSTGSAGEHVRAWVLQPV